MSASTLSTSYVPLRVPIAFFTRSAFSVMNFKSNMLLFLKNFSPKIITL